MKKHLVGFSATAASLGGLLFGFDTSVISGTTDAMQKLWNLSAGELGFTVSCALIGTIIGALGGGMPADKYGRLPMLKVIAFLYTTTAVLVAVAPTWWFFIVFRTLGGVAIGASSVIAPLYLAEIAPTKRRGKLVATFQLNIVMGIVLAYLSNFIIVKLMPIEIGWRWMLAVQAVPAVVFWILCYVIPESPRWLYRKGRTEEAKEIMGGLFDDDEYNRVLTLLRKPQATQKASAPFFNKHNARPIFMAALIAFFSQFAGTNAVLYYAPSLLANAGIPGDAAFAASILVGLTNLIFTFIGRALVDRVGRRPLVGWGTAIDCIALFAIAFIFARSGGKLDQQSGILVLVLILVFIAALATGIGSVLWVFISESFAPAYRAGGQAVGSASHWISAAIISGTFPVLFEWSKTGTFIFYGACMFVAVLWVIFLMPETKGRALEEIGADTTN